MNQILQQGPLQFLCLFFTVHQKFNSGPLQVSMYIKNNFRHVLQQIAQSDTNGIKLFSLCFLCSYTMYSVPSETLDRAPQTQVTSPGFAKPPVKYWLTVLVNQASELKLSLQLLAAEMKVKFPFNLYLYMCKGKRARNFVCNWNLLYISSSPNSEKTSWGPKTQLWETS